MLKRRKALKILVAGMTTAMVPAGVVATTLSGVERTGMRHSLRTQLTQLIGSNFRLTDTYGTAKKAVLVAVEEGPRSAGLEQFSAVFEGDELEEGLHEVYHCQTGNSLISFVPSGESETGQVRQRAHFSIFA